MIPVSLDAFRTILIVDTEYVATPGEPYDPVALGVQVYGTEEVQVYGRADLLRWRTLPFPTGPEVLIVAYNAAAESGFLQVLGLAMPTCWLDLMAESRVMRNVCIPKKLLATFAKRHPEVFAPNRDISLLQTADMFGIEGGSADSKEEARELVLSRAWADDDPHVWQQILRYCASDVRVTAQLFAKMAPHLDVRPALIRGRYVAEHGRMEQRGIPIDTATYDRLRHGYQRVLAGYKLQVDPDGSRLTPKGRISQKWLPGKITALGARETHPRTPGGRPSTKARALADTAERCDDTELRDIAQWAEMLALFPERKEGGLRFSPLGSDGRIRYHQFAFATHTGRALGRGKEALMQLPAWMRGLVQPTPGEVLIAADYAAQEVAVAAGLSQDPHLRAAYEAGDPYRQIAALSGVLTEDTEEEQARKIRRLFKSLVLGRLYGLGVLAFRRRSGVSREQAARVWTFFDRKFSRCNVWQEHTVAKARRLGWIKTRYGWKALVYSSTRTTALLNWLIQSTAADILRLATILLAEAGFALLTTCHDSLLISVPEDGAEADQAAIVRIMQEAAEMVTGIVIRVDVQMMRPGERWLSADTRPMWGRIMGLLDRGETEACHGSVRPRQEMAS